MTRARTALAVLALTGMLGAEPAAGQGYRGRIDLRSQSVRYRGWQPDSILASDIVIGPSGGEETPEGFAVTCVTGDPYCYHFRAGPVRHAAPSSATGTLTMWGLGLQGLSAHGSFRLLTDLTGDDYWPGTQPAAQLIELYADLRRDWYGVRLGRLIESNRHGVTGYDGVKLSLRTLRHRLEFTGYGGLGLARSSLLPINSPELDPFNQFQLPQRQIIAGGSVSWRDRRLNAALSYERQVDRATKHFISERAALSGGFRFLKDFSLRGSAEYDFDHARVGTADAALNWNSGLISATAGYRRYRPSFQLWEIWSVFNTIPYRAAFGSLWLGPWKGLQFTFRGEAYQYQDNKQSTPLVTAESSGWRSRLGASYTYRRFNLGLGYSADNGPGAASHGWDALLGYVPTDNWQFTVSGGRTVRPLEYRFAESELTFLGLDASFMLPERFQVRARADYYDESRNRPDAAAFSWDQTRLSLDVTFFFSSKVRGYQLPPGRMPEQGR